MILEQLSAATGLERAFLTQVTYTASHRYKTYRVPKKTKGLRTIHHPARELKLLQTWLAQVIFSRLPIHDSAIAYRRGRNIGTNAGLHAANNYLLKVDFQDFFPSITGEDVEQLLRANRARIHPVALNEQDYRIIRQLVSRNDRLTIGAPTSPVLSNAVMYDFDVWWAERCGPQAITYTRYADDLFFSTNTPRLLEGLLVELREDLAQRRHPHLTINNRKTVFTSRKHKRLVTGLVLTCDGKVSLGRKQKRKIRSLVHKKLAGTLGEDVAKYLIGYLSFARSVEPQFIESLRKKFGHDRFDHLHE